MKSIEVRGTTPAEMVHEIEASVRQTKDHKYAFQVGLKDLDFDITEELLSIHGLNVPFRSIASAERALMAGAIQPREFIEYDDTRHQVLAFDASPVGYSGFMDCVTHSLALTDLGLFEVGRYPGMNLGSGGRSWQWFLHRRLASIEEAHTWRDAHPFSNAQFLDTIYKGLTGFE
jgi:hypothetical protein